jgi:hypothetical protein
MRLRTVFSFPNPVNEVAARVVAGTVVILCVLIIALPSPWLLIPLVYGFWARVLMGPKISPAGLLATKVAAPRLSKHPKMVAGPPKRLAQAMGTAFSTTALILWFGFGLHTAALIVTGLLAAAAFLESVFAFCLGCEIFALLMRLGAIPESVCQDCANVQVRYARISGTSHPQPS